MPQRNKVLITGSGGMLGLDLVPELDSDYELSGIDISDNKGLPVKNFYKADITDRKEISRVIQKAKPDVVVHTAAWTDVDGCESDPEKALKINAGGAESVALACREAGAALVYISTDFVFDGTKHEPYTEEDRPNPISVYGDSKLKGEEALKKVFDRYYILRTSWLYGKHGKNFVDTILNKSRTEKTLKVVIDQAGSPTYTKDLAKAIHGLLGAIRSPGHQVTMSPDYGIYHISNSGSVSWYEYTKEILALARRNTEVIPISSAELARPARRPAMSVLDNSKFIKFTGFIMRHWKDALKEYILQNTEV